MPAREPPPRGLTPEQRLARLETLMASYLEALTTLEEKLAAVEKAVDERDRAATAHAQQIGARLDTLLDGITSTTPSGDGPSKANTENTLSSSLPSWTSSPSHDPRGIL